MTMRDVTADLARGYERRADWSPSLASVVSWTLALVGGLRVDWDGDAGESWLRIMRGGTPIGYVAVDLPLVFVQAGVGPWPYPLVAVEVSDLADATLQCAEVVLASVFGRVPERAGFDPQAFSAESLWYATV
jgi:hypothetical protein